MKDKKEREKYRVESFLWYLLVIVFGGIGITMFLLDPSKYNYTFTQFLDELFKFTKVFIPILSLLGIGFTFFPEKVYSEQRYPKVPAERIKFKRATVVKGILFLTAGIILSIIHFL